jgi:hypothetical protein
MAIQHPTKNKMMGTVALKEYFFAGDNEFGPITITAENMEEAQNLYADLKKKSTEPIKPAAAEDVE